MEAVNIPVKMPIVWGASAGGGFIRTVAITSQIGINNGFASFTDGFVPLNFVNPNAGGVPPFGEDMNGALNAVTAWNQWQQAGGAVYYDATFSTGIGGYPQGAILNAVGITAGYWWNEVDNNTSNPDTGGSNWFFIQMGNLSTYVGIIPQTTYFVNNSIGSDTLYDGTQNTISGSHGPWATLGHAIAILSTYNLGGQTVILQLGATGTYAGPLTINAPSNGILTIQGNTSSQSSYVISGAPSTSAPVIHIATGNVALKGLTVTNNGSNATTQVITCFNTGSLTLTNVTMTSSVSVTWILGVEGGTIAIGAGCIIGSSAQFMLVTEYNGQMILEGNLTVSGTPTYASATMLASSCGVFYFGAPGGWTITGSASGVKYNAILNGIINTSSSGAGFFPGSSAGTTSTGGQYA
jgi:hypothetical protein